MGDILGHFAERCNNKMERVEGTYGLSLAVYGGHSEQPFPETGGFSLSPLAIMRLWNPLSA
jgi:hypothetical protein